jgi:hypothetical protein
VSEVAYVSEEPTASKFRTEMEAGSPSRSWYLENTRFYNPECQKLYLRPCEILKFDIVHVMLPGCINSFLYSLRGDFEYMLNAVLNAIF